MGYLGYMDHLLGEKGQIHKWAYFEGGEPLNVINHMNMLDTFYKKIRCLRMRVVIRKTSPTIRVEW